MHSLFFFCYNYVLHTLYYCELLARYRFNLFKLIAIIIIIILMLVLSQLCPYSISTISFKMYLFSSNNNFFPI